MLVVTVVGRRGQITLPQAIRRQAGIQEGDRIAFVFQGDRILIQPLTETLLDLRGSIPVSGPQDFDAIRHETFRRRFSEQVENEG